MKIIYYLISLFMILSISFASTSCENETSEIGNALASGEVTITVDSLIFNLPSKTVEVENYDSRTGNLLLGNLNVEQFGLLECSFVTRLMCAPSLNIPDSIFGLENYLSRVDSCKLMLQVSRGALTGDSLAPQKLSVFELTRQLPSDINNTFNPEGYYDPSNVLGEKSFIISNIAKGDSAFYNESYVPIDIKLPDYLGKEIFQKYKENPEIFSWPQTFAQYFPGIFVKQTFGKGCIANIGAAYVAVYYHHLTKKTTIENNDTIISQVNVADSVMPFIVSPEVLSSNNIRYEASDYIKNLISDGKKIVTTPGGFSTTFSFPAHELIEIYHSNNSHLSTVNDLVLSIPGSTIEDNNMGFSVAPTLAIIKTSDVEEFFAKNKVPDNLTSFTAVFDKSKNCYTISSMRQYILDLMSKDEINDEDIEFTVVPVEISSETTSSYYGSGSTYITKCVPYTSKPTITILDFENTSIVFSFSSQMID